MFGLRGRKHRLAALPPSQGRAFLDLRERRGQNHRCCGATVWPHRNSRRTGRRHYWSGRIACRISRLAPGEHCRPTAWWEGPVAGRRRRVIRPGAATRGRAGGSGAAGLGGETTASWLRSRWRRHGRCCVTTDAAGLSSSAVFISDDTLPAFTQLIGATVLNPSAGCPVIRRRGWRASGSRFRTAAERPAISLTVLH